MENGDLTAGLSWVSNLDNAIGSGGGFSTSLSVGTHVVTASVTDSGGLLGSATINVTVEVLPPSGLAVEPVVVPNVSNTAWTAVSLSNTYGSMVVVCSPNYDSSSAPLTPRVRNAAGSGFDLRVDRLDGSAAPISGVPVHCVAAEEGVYNTADHGVKMEAVKYTSTVTDRAASWVGENRSYANSYTSPVVIGQVMSYNDPAFSVFWARGASRNAPPSSSTLFTGKNVAEDANLIRADEIVGYIVIESGTGTIGALEYTAATGSDTIRGVSNAPPYSYAIGGLTSVSSAIVSAAAMDGNNGGWPILYGLNPVTTGGLQLGFDEDQIKDPERSHTTEQVAYLVLGAIGPPPNQPPTANAGADQTVTDADGSGAEAVTLNGGGSDSDGTVNSYEWKEGVTVLGSAATLNASLSAGTHTLVLTVTDDDGAKGSDTVIVTVNPTLQSITVAPGSYSIEEGQTGEFTATGNYSDLSTVDLTSTAAWSSSTPGVATISATGMASGVAAGSSNITATQDGVVSNTAVLTVTEPPPTLQSITVAPGSCSIEEGQTGEFTATGNYSDLSTVDLTSTAAWSSSTPGVATISATGMASGVAAGSSNITATQDGVVSNTAVLTVTEPPPTLQSITVAPGSYSIEEGQTGEFTATGNYSDLSTVDLTSTAAWSSSTPGVATISATGMASGVAAGSSNITATQDGVVSNTAVLTVTEPPPPPPPPPVQEITLQVKEGYDEKNSKTLSEDGKLTYVQANDTDRFETISEYFTSFEFDSLIPATAVIKSVKISVVHYEESGFGAGNLECSAGGGTLTNPNPTLTTNPTLFLNESGEGLSVFDVKSEMIDTAAEINALIFVIQNNDSANSKKTHTDHIFVAVQYSE